MCVCVYAEGWCHTRYIWRMLEGSSPERYVCGLVRGPASPQQKHMPPPVSSLSIHHHHTLLRLYIQAKTGTERVSAPCWALLADSRL